MENLGFEPINASRRAILELAEYTSVKRTMGPLALTPGCSRMHVFAHVLRMTKAHVKLLTILWRNKFVGILLGRARIAGLEDLSPPLHQIFKLFG